MKLPVSRLVRNARALVLGSVLVAFQPVGAQESAAPPCSLTIEVEVPEGTGAVYATGGQPALGMWNPTGLALEGTGTLRTGKIDVPCGTQVEYKITLGSWEHEALNDDGSVPGNRTVTVSDAPVDHFKVARFKEGIESLFKTMEKSGVIGGVEIYPDVKSRQDILPRTVMVWLPPVYSESDRRYPVLYMHDGQNAFDPRMSATGIDWGIDEAVSLLSAAGSIAPPIVVCVFNTQERSLDYSPYDKGELYAKFLIEEVKPSIDAKYRTLPDPAHTATMGSSLGGLISLYLVREHPETFGAGACLSAHLQYQEERYLKDIETTGRFPRNARVYVDHGTKGIDETYEPFHQRLKTFFLAQGMKDGIDFEFYAAEGADHNEAAWRERLSRPLLFLYGKREAAPASQ